MLHNSFHHNRIGLTFEGAPFTPGAYVRLRDNLIGFNQLAIAMSTTVGAQFGGNTFVGNLRQADTTGGSIEHHNSWQIDGGNYWDDYRGYDADGDGMGDIEYRYRPAYGELVQRSPHSVRQHSRPAGHRSRCALVPGLSQCSSRLTFIDTSPLMQPTRHLRESSEDAGRWATTSAFAILIVAAVAVLGVSGRTWKKW